MTIDLYINEANDYAQEFPEGLTYGIGTYHEGDGYATGQTPRQFFDRQRK